VDSIPSLVSGSYIPVVKHGVVGSSVSAVVVDYVDITWGTASSGTWTNSGNSTYRSGTDDWSGYNSGQDNCNPTGTLNDMKIQYDAGSSNFGAIGYSKTLAEEPSAMSDGFALSFQAPANGVRFYKDGTNIGTISGSVGFDSDTVFKLIMKEDVIQIYIDDVLKVDDTTVGVASGDYYAWGIAYTVGSSAKLYGEVKNAS